MARLDLSIWYGSGLEIESKLELASFVKEEEKGEKDIDNVDCELDGTCRSLDDDLATLVSLDIFSHFRSPSHSIPIDFLFF